MVNHYGAMRDYDEARTSTTAVVVDVDCEMAHGIVYKTLIDDSRHGRPPSRGATLEPWSKNPETKTHLALRRARLRLMLRHPPPEA
jgi:hypothetical protein